jgi:hypothetical protein
MDTIIFKIDKKLKEKAQKQAKKGGFSLSDYYRHATISLADGECTMEIVERPQLKEKVVHELLKISKEAREGKNLSPVFASVEEMKKYLSK